MSTNNIVIKHVTKHMFDVFYGEQGWEDWARFRVDQGRLHPVTCEKQLPQPVMNLLRSRYSRSSFLRREKK